MRSSTKTGLCAAALCILALVAAACTAPASIKTAAPDAGAGGTMAGRTQEQQTNSFSLPPDAAIAACSGKAAGDSCRFQDHNGPATGTCDEKPGILACAPARFPAGGQVPGGETSLPATTPPAAMAGNGTAALPVAPPAGNATFVLASEAGADGGTMPDLYSCDGAGASPAMSWTGAPAGTREFALMMTTIPVDGSTRWNWVLYHIPGTATGIARNGSSIGVTGTGSHGTVMQYDPPCPQGPGDKTYTFTLYALSGSPAVPVPAEQVTGQVLRDAISPLILAQTSLNVSYGRV